MQNSKKGNSKILFLRPTPTISLKTYFITVMVVYECLQVKCHLPVIDEFTIKYSFNMLRLSSIKEYRSGFLNPSMYFVEI